MTKRQKEKLIHDIKELLTSTGWMEDNFGNFKKQDNDGLYRFKFQSTSLRLESQVIHSDNTKSWVRLKSAYIKDLSIENNEIVGMAHTL